MSADNAVDRWKNRRAMAWLAFIASLLFPLLLLVPEMKGVDKLIEIASMFYMFTTGVVGAYIGFATFDDKWQK